jgi:hypothetical protein
MPHIRLVYNGDEWYGLYINGKKVAEDQPIHAEDVFSILETHLGMDAKVYNLEEESVDWDDFEELTDANRGRFPDDLYEFENLGFLSDEDMKLGNPRFREL